MLVDEDYEGARKVPTGRYVRGLMGMRLVEMELRVPVFKRKDVTAEDHAGAARQRWRREFWKEDRRVLPRNSR